MPHTPADRPAILALLPILMIGHLALVGCSPLTVSFTLGGDPGRLTEATVATAGRSSSPQAKVALIDVRGLIAEERQPALLGPGDNPADELAARLDRAARDPEVRAVVLRINSPGGTVTGSDVLYREIRRFRGATGKPVVASLGEVAASGGYYIALAADAIVAEPTTITGSIGVIIPTINLSEGMARLGIRSITVTSGPNKDLASPLEPIRDGQYAILRGIVDEYYHSFADLVRQRRPGADPARLPELTDGRILTGAQAHREKLVDELGGVRDAFDRARALAGLDAARLVKYTSGGQRPRSPYAHADAPVPAADAASPHTLRLDLGPWTHALPPGPGVYYLWIPGQP